LEFLLETLKLIGESIEHTIPAHIARARARAIYISRTDAALHLNNKRQFSLRVTFQPCKLRVSAAIDEKVMNILHGE